MESSIAVSRALESLKSFESLQSVELCNDQKLIRPGPNAPPVNVGAMAMVTL